MEHLITWATTWGGVGCSWINPTASYTSLKSDGGLLYVVIYNWQFKWRCLCNGQIMALYPITIFYWWYLNIIKRRGDVDERRVCEWRAESEKAGGKECTCGECWTNECSLFQNEARISEGETCASRERESTTPSVRWEFVCVCVNKETQEREKNNNTWECVKPASDFRLLATFKKCHTHHEIWLFAL